jgi:uncharacterized protein YegL
MKTIDSDEPHSEHVADPAACHRVSARSECAQQRMQPSSRVARLAATGIALLASAMLSGCYMAKKSDRYYGLRTEGQKIAFVLDISGSMEGRSEGSLQDQLTGQAVQRGGNLVAGAIGGSLGAFVGRHAASEATKLGTAKRELIPAVQGLPESAQFTIITFGAKVAPWMMGISPATATNRAAAVATIKGLTADGSTPAHAALELAFSYPDISAIFFVSDGQPTDATADGIVARVGELNATRHVPVYTVGLGPDQDERFLRLLAERNGGQYVKRE